MTNPSTRRARERARARVTRRGVVAARRRDNRNERGNPPRPPRYAGAASTQKRPPVRGSPVRPRDVRRSAPIGGPTPAPTRRGGATGRGPGRRAGSPRCELDEPASVPNAARTTRAPGARPRRAPRCSAPGRPRESADGGEAPARALRRTGRAAASSANSFARALRRGGSVAHQALARLRAPSRSAGTRHASRMTRPSTRRHADADGTRAGLARAYGACADAAAAPPPRRASSARLRHGVGVGAAARRGASAPQGAALAATPAATARGRLLLLHGRANASPSGKSPRDRRTVQVLARRSGRRSGRPARARLTRHARRASAGDGLPRGVGGACRVGARTRRARLPLVAQHAPAKNAGRPARATGAGRGRSSRSPLTRRIARRATRAAHIIHRAVVTKVDAARSRRVARAAAAGAGRRRDGPSDRVGAVLQRPLGLPASKRPLGRGRRGLVVFGARRHDRRSRPRSRPAGSEVQAVERDVLARAGYRERGERRERRGPSARYGAAGEALDAQGRTGAARAGPKAARPGECRCCRGAGGRCQALRHADRGVPGGDEPFARLPIRIREDRHRRRRARADDTRIRGAASAPRCGGGPGVEGGGATTISNEPSARERISIIPSSTCCPRLPERRLR